MYDEMVVCFFFVMGVIFGFILRVYWVMIVGGMVFVIIVWVVDWVYDYIVNGWVNVFLVVMVSFILVDVDLFGIIDFIDGGVVVNVDYVYFI